jgi:hypothetical protein
MAHVDKVDKDLARQEEMKAVEKAFPYLKGHITSDNVLSALDWIRTVYKKPLSASMRILLRNKVQSLIENEQLPQETIDGLVKLMEEYGAL